MSDTFSNIVECATDQVGQFPQSLRVRSHTFRADVGPDLGGTDSAPSPHDYFDGALAACKALTAVWYAKRHDIPLERVATRIERNDSAERQGTYRLRVHLEFEGPISTEQRTALERAVAACPIHKLMTRVEIEIETVV